MKNTSKGRVSKVCSRLVSGDLPDQKLALNHPKHIQNGQIRPFSPSIFDCASFWLVSFLDFGTHQSPIISLRSPMIPLIISQISPNYNTHEVIQQTNKVLFDCAQDGASLTPANGLGWRYAGPRWCSLRSCKKYAYFRDLPDPKLALKHPKHIQNGQNRPFSPSMFHCASFWLV